MNMSTRRQTSWFLATFSVLLLCVSTAPTAQGAPEDFEGNAWTLGSFDGALYASDLIAGSATDATGFLGVITPDALAPGLDDVVYALSFDRYGPVLYKIETDPASASAIYPHSPFLPNIYFTLSGLAFDAQTGRLYTSLFYLEQGVPRRFLATIDPETAWVKPVAEIDFQGAAPAFTGLSALAFDPLGDLYAIDAPGTEAFRIWRVNPNTGVATFVAANSGGYETLTDMAFLGSELWVLQDPASPLFLELSLDPGSEGTVLQTETLNITDVAGLAQRLCVRISPLLKAEDAANDAGGAIQLDWSGYNPPPGATGFEILRSTDACDLQVLDTVDLSTFEYLDATAENYVSYYYAVQAIDVPFRKAPSGPAATGPALVAGPASAFPNLLINEFAPSGGVGPGKRVGEIVEIRNQAGVPLSLVGFRLSNGAGAPTPDEEPLPDVTIAAGGLYVHTLSVISLPDAGGTLSLLAPEPSSFSIDIVGYGTQGGAPTVPAGFTVMRVEGTTAGDPDDTSFEAGTSTAGATNNVVAPDLGGSIQMNEIVFTTTTVDYVELYNPLGTVIDLSVFAISDGVNFLTTLAQTIQLAPGGFQVLRQSDATLPGEISTDQMYLYKILPGGLYQLVDQKGWSGGPGPTAPNDALLQVPDGGSVYLGDQGANWVECGGGTVQVFGPRSPGQHNTVPGAPSFTVDPQAGQGDFTSIDDAINAAPYGSTVVIQPGTYNESISMKSGIRLVGGGASPEEVVILGDEESSGMYFFNVDASASVSGITISATNGYRGGGMRIDNSSPLIRNVHFVQCEAYDSGGAVYVTGVNSFPIFEGCLFKDNYGSEGGAIYNDDGTVVVRSSLFVSNSSGYYGGAVYNGFGSMTIEHCVFDLNSTGDFGTIVYSLDGTTDMTFSTITNSQDSEPFGGGEGGVTNFSCGDLYNNGTAKMESLTASVAGIDLATTLFVDPEYCDAATLNYAYGDGSPLTNPPTACSEVIGIAGPPCVIATAVSDDGPALRATLLSVPTPNPFNPSTTLSFELSTPGRVWLTIFDVRGRRVADPVPGNQLNAGLHEVQWRGTDHRGAPVAGGVYMAQLRVDGDLMGPTRKMVLLK